MSEGVNAGGVPEDNLKQKLVMRVAFAGVLIAVLLAALAFIDYLGQPAEEPVASGPTFSSPVPVPKKEVSQPVKNVEPAAPSATPEAPKVAEGAAPVPVAAPAPTVAPVIDAPPKPVVAPQPELPPSDAKGQVASGRTAARMLREDAPQITMQPTELLHEAALKLIRLDEMQWQDRAHFLAICCRVMRQVVIDRIRHVKSAKREHVKVTITHLADSLPAEEIDADRLDGLLQRLEAVSPDHAQLVEMRFFAGMSVAEIAHVRGISERTVKRQWQAARAWLLESLDD